MQRISMMILSLLWTAIGKSVISALLEYGRADQGLVRFIKQTGRGELSKATGPYIFFAQ